ncbi:hypothetical protein GCM10022248_63180 [Nonomuraea soli]
MKWSRFTWVSLGVRLVLAASGCLALNLSFPPQFADGPLWPPLSVALAIFAAVWPRSPAVSGMIAATVTIWIVGGLVYDAPIDPLGALLVGCALYVQHTSAALAAQVPLASDIPARLIGPWALRTGLVLVVTTLVYLVVVTVPPLLGSVPTLVMLPLGALGAVTVAAVVRHVLQRPPAAE